MLGRYLQTRRWFAGKASTLKALAIEDAIELGEGAVLMFVSAEYTDAQPHKDVYSVVFAAAFAEEAARVQRELSQVVVCRLEGAGSDAVLYEGLWSKKVSEAIFTIVARK